MTYADKNKEREWFRNRYAKNIKYVNELKLEKGCTDCSYKEHVAALEFDHILLPKRGTVSSQMGKSLKVILEEIERCEIVCANCHAIREYERNLGLRTDGAHGVYLERKGPKGSRPSYSNSMTKEAYDRLFKNT